MTMLYALQYLRTRSLSIEDFASAADGDRDGQCSAGCSSVKEMSQAPISGSDCAAAQVKVWRRAPCDSLVATYVVRSHAGWWS